MTALTIQETLPEIEYPESDGLPMSDNTKQWDLMVLIKEGLEAYFATKPDVFVAGNLLWYPIEGDNRTRCAPDVMIAFGRPKGPRGSYLQWKEGGIAPQVVFEVLSPSNTRIEMRKKAHDYEQYGVDEFYILDPDDGSMSGFQRVNGEWQEIPEMVGWVSPRLGIRFDVDGGEIIVEDPTGRPFASYSHVVRERNQAESRERRANMIAQRNRAIADQEKARADEQTLIAEQAMRDAEQATRDAEQARREVELERAAKARLMERLRALGIDPSAESFG